MDLNFGIKPIQSKMAEDLYKLALQCAHSSAEVGCNMCAECPYNTARYNWDPDEVKLMQARATLEYQQTKQNKQISKKNLLIGELVFIVAIIFLLIFLAVGISLIDPPTETYKPPASIEAATTYVRANIRDVNFDNKINCIDYTVIFYEIWPNAKMIRCRGDNFNHLLIKVGNKYIEPQTRSGDPLVLWSNRFSASTKVDETDLWAWWAVYRKWW